MPHMNMNRQMSIFIPEMHLKMPSAKSRPLGRSPNVLSNTYGMERV